MWVRSLRWVGFIRHHLLSGRPVHPAMADPLSLPTHGAEQQMQFAGRLTATVVDRLSPALEEAVALLGRLATR